MNRNLAACGMAAALVLAFAAQGTAQVFVGPDAAVRFEGVKPTKTLVYLDGYYAGIVDDFDGVFQRLYTAPGPHEITLFLDGYRTFTQHAYLTPDHTFKVRHQMELLQPGETSEKPPVPPPPPPNEQGPAGPRGPNGRRQRQPPDEAPAATQQGRGTLELTLQPADAEVLVDGQSWQRTGADHVTIDLSAGRHNLQVRKSGYVGYLTDVDIRPSETTTLDVNLKAQAPR
jgi:PEGA domain